MWRDVIQIFVDQQFIVNNVHLNKTLYLQNTPRFFNSTQHFHTTYIWKKINLKKSLDWNLRWHFNLPNVLVQCDFVKTFHFNLLNTILQPRQFLPQILNKQKSANSPTLGFHLLIEGAPSFYTKWLKPHHFVYAISVLSVYIVKSKLCRRRWNKFTNASTY